MYPPNENKVVQTKILSILLTSDDSLIKDLTTLLDELSPEAELHIVRTKEMLRQHAKEILPDVVIITTKSDADRKEALEFVRDLSTLLVVVDDLYRPDFQLQLFQTGNVGYLVKGDFCRELLARTIIRAGHFAQLAGRISEHQQHLIDILEATGDGFLLLVDEKIEYANRSFLEMLSYSSDDISTLKIQDITVEEDRVSAAEHLAHILVNHAHRSVFELTLLTSDKKQLRCEIEAKATVVRGKRGIVCTLRDVTELRKAQAAIDVAKKHAAQADRLRALGEMAAGVAHNFNNILETILGRIELVRERVQQGLDVEHDLNIIHEAARDATTTVKRIGDFSKPSGLDTWHSVNLQSLVMEVGEFARTRIPTSVIFSIDAEPTPPIQGNDAELREAFLNLLTNAADAVGQSGSITFRSCTQNGNAVVLVEDDGQGMDDHVRDRIFEPFFSTKGEQGTGLGLSVTHGILRRHDAAIELTSTKGKGTAFNLTFSSPKFLVRESPKIKATTLNVLVVDDDPSVGELIKDLLTEEGHQVRLAETAEEAKRILGEIQPHLLITDLDLPDLSGWQLARSARSEHKDIIVGLITGWPLGANDAELRARGVDFVLSKPFSIDHFTRTIKKIISNEKIV
ncbi:response regulator [Myxococcota bacterium]|nr:response regulator [Myxococcota bacterium]